MHKSTTKHILESIDETQVANATYMEGDSLDEALASVHGTSTYIVVGKPANMGTSAGISRAENGGDLLEAITLALQYDSRSLLAQGDVAREIEAGIFGKTRGKTTMPGEVDKDLAFKDYRAKFFDSRITRARAAEVSAETAEKMRHFASKAIVAIGGFGLVRRDFNLTEGGHIFLN